MLPLRPYLGSTSSSVPRGYPLPLGLEAACEKGQSEGRKTQRNVWQSADAALGREQMEAICLGVICSFTEESHPGTLE